MKFHFGGDKESPHKIDISYHREFGQDLISMIDGRVRQRPDIRQPLVEDTDQDETGIDRKVN